MMDDACSHIALHSICSFCIREKPNAAYGRTMSQICYAKKPHTHPNHTTLVMCGRNDGFHFTQRLMASP